MKCWQRCSPISNARSNDIRLVTIGQMAQQVLGHTIQTSSRSCSTKLSGVNGAQISGECRACIRARGTGEHTLFSRCSAVKQAIFTLDKPTGLDRGDKLSGSVIFCEYPEAAGNYKCCVDDTARTSTITRFVLGRRIVAFCRVQRCKLCACGVSLQSSDV